MTQSAPRAASPTEAIRLQLRSWPEVEAYLEHCKGVIVPLGSTEQHGPTGAIGTDALTAEAVAPAVGRRTGVLVTPAQAFGMAEHHLGFAGTVSLQPSTLLAVLHDIVLSLARVSLNKGLKMFGEAGNTAAYKEMEQLHKREAFKPLLLSEMTKQERERAMESHTVLKEKSDGTIKGRTVADGRSQRAHIPKGAASSPTPHNDSLTMMCAIAA